MADGVGLFDWISSISHTKKMVLTEYNHTKYNIFMINKAFGQHQDTVLYANQMNCEVPISKYAHFNYLNQIVRKRKRFGKWAKEIANPDLDVIMEFYPDMSKEKAKDVLPLLKDKIEEMKKSLDKGGKM